MTPLVSVPCPQCGRDRKLFPCQVTRADSRPCSRCVKYARENKKRREVRVQLPCVSCGEPRDLNQWDAKRATDRPCKRCTLDAIAAAQADVDEMAVERLLAGFPVNSTRAERQAAVAALTARQLPAWVIAERLRVTPRTVERLRARERVGV